MAGSDGHGVVRILLIDASTSDRAFLKQSLQSGPPTPTFVIVEHARLENWQQVLTLIEQEGIDVVLLDPNALPVSALEQLGDCVASVEIPLIIAARSSQQALAKDLVKMGAMAMILKDQASPHSVLESVLQALENKSTESSAEPPVSGPSQQRLALALSASDVGMWEWNAGTNQLYWTPETEAIMGYLPGSPDRCFEDFTERVHPDDSEEVIARLHRSIENKIHFQMDFRILLPGGEVRWLSSSGRAERWSADGAAVVRGTVVDVTARKRSEMITKGQAEVFRKLATGEPLPSILAHIALVVEPQILGSICSVLVVDLNSGCLRLAAAPHLPEQYNRELGDVPIGPQAGSCGTAAFFKQRVIVSDIPHDPKWAAFRDLPEPYGLISCWSEPIVNSRGQVLGTLAVYFKERRAPTSADILVLENTAHLASIAIERDSVLKAIEESERRFKQLSDSMPQMVWATSAEGQTEYLNQQFCEITGLSLGEGIREGWFANIHRSDRMRTLEHWLRCVQEGEPFQVDYRLRHRDGSYRWMLARATPIRDASGAISKWYGTSTDIDDQVDTQKQLAHIALDLKETQEQLELSLQAGEMGSWSWDLNSDKLVWNEISYKLFELGERPKELTGSLVLERLRAEDQRRARQAVESAIGEHSPNFTIEIPIDKPDGAKHTVLARGRIFYDDKGIPQRIVGINMDITSISEAKEAAEAANRAKSQFLANMSHEIRSPLNSVLGYADLLTESPLPEDDRVSYAQRIRSSGEHLLGIIDDILDLSKIEAGQVVVEQQRFSAVALIGDCVQALSVLANKKHIELRLRHTTPIPEWIISDAGKLRQIIMNLLSNSIKFTDQGYVQVSLSFAPAKPPKDLAQLLIEIEDTGIGIPAERQDRLFQPFSQADASITRKYGGTGLGLNLSKHLSHLLGGDLNLTWSALNKGSRFLLSINCGDLSQVSFVQYSKPSVDTKPVSSIGPAGSLLKDVKILLVEDSIDNQALMKIYLGKDQASVRIADNGLEGVRLALESECDIVLMDIAMPILDGLEATRRLRAHGFRKPIVALTAHALKEEVAKSLDAGCNAHISKPVDRRELVQVIRQFVGLSSTLSYVQ